jgi:hypothetical protein
MPQTKSADQRFTQEQAAQIIRQATEYSLGNAGAAHLTEGDVRHLAQELGVDGEAIDRALAGARDRAKVSRQARSALMAVVGHAGTYAIVIAGLAVIDVVSGPGWWVQWPAIGWGMGLALHAFGAGMAILRKTR